MPLAPNMNPFITCALTGSGTTQDRSPHVPRSPEEIAASAIDAAKAGAAIVHCHVREPDTGAPSRRSDLYREVADRIRDSDTDVVLNFTAGMGGDLMFGDVENPLPLNEAGTDMAGASERVAHVAEYVMANTPSMLRAMGHMMTDLGVRPEIEVFETGHLWMAKQLVEEGIIEDPVMIQMCMGIAWGAPDDLNTFMAMVNNTPDDWTFSAFSIGRHQMPFAAAAVLAGGNVRVGLEDNLWLEKDLLATNAQLVEKAATIVTNMGATLMTPAEVREKLKLKKRAAVSR